MSQIELDLIGKFGELPLESIDRFMSQTHVNQLADRYCQDRVKQGRSYPTAVTNEMQINDPDTLCGLDRLSAQYPDGRGCHPALRTCGGVVLRSELSRLLRANDDASQRGYSTRNSTFCLRR